MWISYCTEMFVATLLQVTSPSLVSEVIGMPPITTPTYAKEFKKVIEAAARGRQIFTVQVNVCTLARCLREVHSKEYYN